jgi:hypothetical protein
MLAEVNISNKNNLIMEEITISFTAEELRELAKQLYLASFMTIGFPYDNEEMALDIFNRVCATGYLEAPELGAFRHGGPTETPFQISHDLDDECDPIVEQYDATAVENILPYLLADRDFDEKYSTLEPEEVLRNEELMLELQEMQEKYKLEFERYGVLHLRLEEKR